MKKIILSIVITVAFGSSVKAQQEMNKEAVLHPDGSVTVNTAVTGGAVSGKETGSFAKPNTTVPSNDHSFVRHEAVLLKDGTQEIHLIDASGKVTVISAKKGESVQEKYWAYLKKEGIPCACGSAGATAQNPKTATLPRTPVISKPDTKR